MSTKLKTLKFVQGSVAKKDFMPAMTHFRIEKGSVRGFNGTIAMSAPIDLPVECTPKADQLIKAIGQCTDDIKLSFTPSGRLSLKSGSFRGLVDCSDEEVTPHALPEGTVYAVQGAEMLAAMKALLPFVGDDAARPWSNGILFRGTSAIATCNTVVAEYYTGINFAEAMNIPLAAVKELIRIDEAPMQIQIGNGNMTFHFSGDRWIRTQLQSTEWPDLSRVFNREHKPLGIPEGFFEQVDRLRGFLEKNGAVHFHEGYASTSQELDSETGATVSLPVHEGASFNLDMLMRLNGVATIIDFSAYPAPCLFYGGENNRVRGAIMGMRRKGAEVSNAQ